MCVCAGLQFYKFGGDLPWPGLNPLRKFPTTRILRRRSPDILLPKAPLRTVQFWILELFHSEVDTDT